MRGTPSASHSAVDTAVAVSGRSAKCPLPLCTTARANSPCARGMLSSELTLMPPADSPATVTRAGSPPKAATLSRTHSSAATWSSSPRSSGPPSSKNRNPSTPSR